MQPMTGGPASRGRRGRRHIWGLVSLVLAACIAWAVPANATNVLWVGGTTGSLGRLIPVGTLGSTGQLLGGAYKNDHLTTIDYPASLWPVTGLLDPTLGQSVGIGTSRLEAAAKNTSAPLVIIGTSQGAMVVQQAEIDLNSDPSVPSNTTFILIADPNFGLLRTLQGVYVPGFDYTPAPLPETRFNTIVVINQYDGFADPIKRPWNLLTDLNAVMGIAYVHAFAQNTDLSTVPAGNITTTQNGKTTIYHVPTKQLPLTMPLRQLGVPDAIVDGIDAQLRPIIDEGYVDPAPRHSIPGPRTRAVKPTPNPQSTAAMSRQSPRVTTPHAAQSRSAKSAGSVAQRQRQARP
jgi:hypothetical protein